MDTVDLGENASGRGVSRSGTRANALNVSPFIIEKGTAANQPSARGGTTSGIGPGSSSGPTSDRYGPSSTSGYEDSEAGWTESHSRGAPEREMDAGPLLRASTVMRQGPLPPAYNDILPNSDEQREAGNDGSDGSQAGEGGSAYQPMRLDPNRKN